MNRCTSWHRAITNTSSFYFLNMYNVMYYNDEKFQLQDYDLFIRFGVSWIHLNYIFTGKNVCKYVCICVYAFEWTKIESVWWIPLSSNLICTTLQVLITRPAHYLGNIELIGSLQAHKKEFSYITDNKHKLVNMC